MWRDHIVYSCFEVNFHGLSFSMMEKLHQKSRLESAGSEVDYKHSEGQETGTIAPAP
jgi:hypothetical protein